MGKENEGRTSILVHRLVALLFIHNPNPEEFTEVNHKDFDRTNCRFDNLEWTTHKDNIEYSAKANRYVGKIGDNNPNYNNHTLKEKYKNNPELAKKNNSRPKSQNGRARQIILYDINKNIIKEFLFIGECAEYLINKNITHSKIDSIRTAITSSIKHNKPYLNYYFKFKNELN